MVPLGGRPLIAHVRDRVAPQCDAITMISADARLAAGFPDLPLRPDVVGAPGARLGPLAGILTALEWAAEAAAGRRHVLTVPCDTPFLPADLAARLRAAADPETVAVAESGGLIHHTVALWPVAQAPALREGLVTGAVRAVKSWQAQVPLVTVDFPLPPRGPDPFFNVNTPEDLGAAARFLGIRS